ncbi:MAG: substrate-binding domain-containing protein [Lachnospiraceae bacterium]|nr:substrate-binding domain-containing protein [Lachnospiraceae bacterium]
MERELLYRIIYDDLVEGIQNGKYPAGSKLPSEKELMDQYNVSRITSKKALEMLAEKNVIVRMPGKGSYVLDENKAGEDNSKNRGIAALENETEKRQRLIGVVLDSFGAAFGSDIVAGIEHECWTKHYNMVLKCSYGNIDDEARAIDELTAMGSDGIILMCTQGESYNVRIMRLALDEYPMVLVDRELKGLSIPYIGTDNYAAAKELVNILIEQGHKNICFVSGSPLQTSTVADRFYGYRDGLLEHNIITNEDMWITDLNLAVANLDEFQDADMVMREKIREYALAHEQVTAYFAINENIAATTYRALKEAGIDREVVFFDGMEYPFSVDNQFMHVTQGQYMMGAMAVKTLNKIFKGEEVPAKRYIPYNIVMKDKD